METLACHIRQNVKLKGLNLDPNKAKVIKMTQYADNTTSFLKNNNDLKEAINCLELFGSVALYRIESF